MWEGFGSSSLVTLPRVSTGILFPPMDLGNLLRFALEAAWEALIKHMTTRMNLKGAMLSERRQSQKVIFRMIPFM